jgi:tetratricopeptide (TPR) repeat protein
MGAVMRTEEERIASIFRRATAAKDKGKLLQAIKLLREAYDKASSDGGDCSVDLKLRLPMYLQSAGRASEAWDELLRLLDHYQTCPSIPEFSREPQIGAIYDKMRLFLQREGDHQAAVKYGILSLLHNGRNYALRGQSVDWLLDPQYIWSVCAKLVKWHPEPTAFAAALVCKVDVYVRMLPGTDLKVVCQEIDKLAAVD